jgi:cation diffusion facilitator CzcD-associated flavoprotein CzcO
MASLVVGAKLRDAGIARIRLIDEAGGVGGTWYWNRYPGVMCDIESYIYMPMLEELDYVPTRKYAFGDEIRYHFEAIASRYDVLEDALFHTVVETSTWDDDANRWILRRGRSGQTADLYHRWTSRRCQRVSDNGPSVLSSAP